MQLYAIEHFGLVLDYNVRVTLIYLEQIPMKDISDNLNVKGQRTSRTLPAGTCKVPNSIKRTVTLKRNLKILILSCINQFGP